ncbi:MAG: hypothetical protein AAB116_01530 [Candidatus Poribacteria bacterium]|mgnify:CR=1 FL=1
MGKIIRREFLGSRIRVTLLCLTGIGIPIAIIYIIEATVTIEEEVEDPSDFTKMFRAGKLGRTTIFGAVQSWWSRLWKREANKM